MPDSEIERSRLRAPKLKWVRARAVLLLLGTGLWWVEPLAGQAQEASLRRAQAQIDAEDAKGALETLEPLLGKRSRSANAFFLSSSARFMLGERLLGTADLERALELDPGFRQAWLHRAALYLAEGEHEAAYGAFSRAQELDPAAPDNHLNLGTASLFLGRVAEAESHFSRHLALGAEVASQHFLVSKNYALAGYRKRATQHLAQAIARDERQRLAAKTDPGFEGVLADPGFQQLLNTDSYRPPPGAHSKRLRFDAAYAGGRGPLVGGVIDALGRLGIAFNSRIEVTPDWALIWADLRIKILDEGPEWAWVELTSPAARFTPEQWRSRVEQLEQQIHYQLAPRIPR